MLYQKTTRMIPQFRTSCLPFPYYGITHYQIEIHIDSDKKAFQRHIWIYQDGTVEEEQWIPTSAKKIECLIEAGYIKL